jgi:CRISPR-associated endonuclease Csn1
MPSYCLFRILSEVNNLKLKNIATREQIELSLEQKQIIINKLNSQKSPVKFSTLKKELSSTKIKHQKSPQASLSFDSPEIINQEINYQHDYEFNLESERRLDLQANPTLQLLANDKYFGNLWQQFSLAKQDEIVEFLLEEDEEEIIKNKALSEWQVSLEQAQNLSKLTINHFQNTAVGNMCKEILQKLCEVMQVQNCRYDEALKFLGINHSNENYGNGTADFLSYYASAIPASVVDVKSKFASQEEQDHGKIANPTVHTALNQIRKVINDIIKNHGKPAEIYVELARELKQTKQQKKQTEKQQKSNEAENKEAKKALAENNIIDNYENRLRYKLWKELNFKNINDRKCPYSGKSICITKLFSAEFEIEHILPFSQTFDNSIANKTIASKSANAIKGNRSPFEAFSSSLTYNYSEILQRTKTMPKHKRWRFEPEAMQKFSDQNGFIASQLNDTRYISRVTKQYLQQICPKDNIKIGNGKITALLRHNWGLNSLLHNEDFDCETGEVLNNSSSQNQNAAKNRQDHRHHAIDAICIAMTDQKMLQKISRDNAKNFDLNKLEIQLPNHWNSFREDVAKTIEKIIVSHKKDHGKNVKLHDETNYGKLNKPILVYNDKKKPAECNLVIRTKLTALKKADVYYARDNNIKNLLLAEAEKATSDKEFQEKIMPEFSKNTGIKKVRLYDNNKSVLEISHPKATQHFTKVIKTNGNHHISLWKMPDGTYTTDVVSNFKANCPYEILTRADGFQYINYNKKFSKEQELEKLKPHPAAKLIIRLFKDDLVRIEEDGKIKTVVIKIIGSNTQCFYLSHNIASGKNGSFRLNIEALQSKKICKLFVSPSGKIFDNGPIIDKINKEK